MKTQLPDPEIDSGVDYITSAGQPSIENNFEFVTFGSDNQEYNPFEKSLTSLNVSNCKVHTQLQTFKSTPSINPFPNKRTLSR